MSDQQDDLAKSHALRTLIDMSNHLPNNQGLRHACAKLAGQIMATPAPAPASANADVCVAHGLAHPCEVCSVESCYEQVMADHDRLVRDLDVLLNGEAGAAKQASLCDIVGQIRSGGWRLVPEKLTPAMEKADPYGMGYGRLQAIWSRLLNAARL